METRIPRKRKKQVRQMLFCHTGNQVVKKRKISKTDWVKCGKFYTKKLFCLEDAKIYNGTVE